MASTVKKKATPKKPLTAAKKSTAKAKPEPVSPVFRVVTIPLAELIGLTEGPAMNAPGVATAGIDVTRRGIYAAAPGKITADDPAFSSPSGQFPDEPACCGGPATSSFKIVDDPTATIAPLAFRTSEIDYDGWEACAMVGVDAITDERRGRRGRRGLFAALRGDEYKRRLVTLHIREQYEAAEVSGVVAAAAEPGRFERILKFIYDHREEILAFIQRIIDLFAGMPV